MSSISETTKKKAELIAYDRIHIPKNFKLPCALDRSTAGPGSGFLSIALTFDNKNIKLPISRDHNELFSLKKEDMNFHIMKKDKIFLEDVKINPILFHAPRQAFLNIENRCIYNCSFCNLTDIKKGHFHKYDNQKFVEIILKVSKRPDFKSVALTSGVYPDNKTIVSRMCYIVKNIRKKLPNVPIGIESCIEDEKEISSLKKSGADEIKINLQIPDKDLFKRVCPHLDYENIMNMLKEAVTIFGEGKVTSNIIYGLGESDSIVVKNIEELAEMGIVPTLRRIRINKYNRGKIKKSLSNEIPNVNAERIIKLALKQKNILNNHCLTTQSFKTMCHKCGCCDIVPFWDI